MFVLGYNIVVHMNTCRTFKSRFPFAIVLKKTIIVYVKMLQMLNDITSIQIK